MPGIRLRPAPNAFQERTISDSERYRNRRRGGLGQSAVAVLVISTGRNFLQFLKSDRGEHSVLALTSPLK